MPSSVSVAWRLNGPLRISAVSRRPCSDLPNAGALCRWMIEMFLPLLGTILMRVMRSIPPRWLERRATVPPVPSGPWWNAVFWMRFSRTAPHWCSSIRVVWPKSSPRASMISMRRPGMAPIPTLCVIRALRKAAKGSPHITMLWSAPPPCLSAHMRAMMSSPWLIMGRSPKIAAK